MSKIILLVTGSRSIYDADFVFKCMDETYSEYKFGSVIVGDASGVDYLVTVWCRMHDILYDVRKADWARYKKGAGPIRNCEMVLEATYGIGIHDGKSPGTAHCVGELKKAGKLLRVFIYDMER